MTASKKKQLHSKLVYIHELDSVRNSDAEIERARKCLYDEIPLNGNTPVISFNQLTDSKAFLGLITESAMKAHDEEPLPGDGSVDDDHSRDSLLNMEYLMREGRIRIVRFGKKRTASQYLQENLDPKRAREEDEFILSGWPIPCKRNDSDRDALIESIRLALKNSDPDYLDRHSRDERLRVKAGFGKGAPVVPALTDGEIRPLKQLFEFMLFISKAEFAYAGINPGTKPGLAAILELVVEQIESGEIVPSGVDDKSVVAGACANLRARRDGIEKNFPGKIGNRSAWHRALREPPADGSRVQELSFAIVDLCYNLTIEAGIDRCSHFFNPSGAAESVNVELGKKLGEYVADYKKFGHTYKDGTQCDPDEERIEVSDGLDWDLAVSIQRALSRRFDPQAGKTVEGGGVESYGSELRAHRAKWRRNVYGALRFQTLGALLYVVLFAFIEVVLSLIDNLIEGAGKTALASNAPGIEDMFTFNRTVAISVIFLIGVVAYALLTQKNRSHSVKVPIIGVAVIFFVVMPVLACIEVVPATSGTPMIEFEMADFIDNFVAMLPSLFVGLVAVIAFAWIGTILEERTGVPALFDSMRLTKASVVDALRFWRLTRLQCEDAGTAAYCAIPPDPWDALFGETDKEDDGSSPAWRKYVELVKTHDGDSAFDPALEIILDEEAAREYTDTSGHDIGIIYDSPYNTLVVDLVRDGNGQKFAYERLIPKADSGVVIVPRHDEKFVLLDQFRHAIRRRQLAFPRGFGEEGLEAAANACKELGEELNLATPIEKSQLTFLGKLTPDSGISANEVSVYACKIGDYSFTEGNEGILGVREMSDDELRAAIAKSAAGGKICTSSNAGAAEDDVITDGFTLAAFAMWKCREGKARKKRRCLCPRQFLRQKP